ncbi:MAG: serine protease [Minwuiales bacterium]|nr:serine protease [Minwuiales bacterium]
MIATAGSKGRAWAAAAALTLLAGCAATGGTDHKNRVIAAAVGSTIQLFNEREGGGRRAGSAVVLSHDEESGRSIVLTAAHLVEPPVPQSVYALAPDTGERIPADLIAVDTATDLALLSATGLDARPVRLSRSAWLGDSIWVVAFPWGRERTVVTGVVSQIDAAATGGDRTSIEGAVRLIDASVSYGMSGGGVFDSRTGALVGVVRGYRTAQLSFGDSGFEPLQLPVAGETTVIPTADIVCFLQSESIQLPGTPPLAAC